jgi:phosphatidylcholine synthase
MSRIVMPPIFSRQTAALAVHLLTALGTVIGFAALIAAVQGEFTVMFALLGLALIIDGFDGSLARIVGVKEALPRISGDTLDLVVDYLNYVFVPAFALASSALMPTPLAISAAIAILLSSALYFADSRMKTDDGYFRGFPAIWNIVVFYLFLAQPTAIVAAVVVALLVVLTFVPVYFPHPVRASRWPWLNYAVLGLGIVLAFAALFYHLVPPPIILYGLYAVVAYFVAMGLMRLQGNRN